MDARKIVSEMLEPVIEIGGKRYESIVLLALHEEEMQYLGTGKTIKALCIVNKKLMGGLADEVFDQIIADIREARKQLKEGFNQ